MPDNKPMSAGERYGVLGRRFIRKAEPGKSTSNSKPIKLWDISTKPGTTAARLQAVYLDSLSTVDRVESSKAEAASSGKYTSDGVRAQTLQVAVQQAGIFKRGRQQIEAAKREAADLRSKISLQPTDRADLVGAVLRAEMRDFLRSKSPADRDAYLRDNADRLDPQLALAITEMPPEISGVSTLQRDALIEKALEAQHPGALQEVQQLEAAIEVAELAVNLGREEIIKEAGADAHEFNQLAAPIEARVGVDSIWLKKFTENGVEVTKALVLDATGKSGSWLEATAHQLETGIVAASHEEYLAMKAGN